MRHIGKTVVIILQGHYLNNENSGLIRGVASLEDNLAVFYYLSASEIWPEKNGLISGGLLCYLCKVKAILCYYF